MGLKPDVFQEKLRQKCMTFCMVAGSADGLCCGMRGTPQRLCSWDYGATVMMPGPFFP